MKTTGKHDSILGSQVAHLDTRAGLILKAGNAGGRWYIILWSTGNRHKAIGAFGLVLVGLFRHLG